MQEKGMSPKLESMFKKGRDLINTRIAQIRPEKGDKIAEFIENEARYFARYTAIMAMVQGMPEDRWSMFKNVLSDLMAHVSQEDALHCFGKDFDCAKLIECMNTTKALNNEIASILEHEDIDSDELKAMAMECLNKAKATVQ